MAAGSTDTDGSRHGPAPLLLERDLPLRALAGAFKAAGRDGRGALVALVGEAGTGKTALVDAARDLAGERFAILAAGGSAMETDIPFAYAEQALGLLDPDLGTPDPDARHQLPVRRAEVFSRARRRLGDLAGERPVAILLEDLHWADPDSLALVGFLARRLATLPVVVVVVTARPWPAAAAREMTAVGHDRGHVAVHRLRPLSRAGTAALLAERAGVPLDAETARRAWGLTGGNPLLTVEAAKALAADGNLPDPTRPGGARQPTLLLLRYLGGLDDAALACLRGASVLGPRVRLSAVRAVADLPGDRFAAAFDSLVATGILRSSKPGWAEFHHEMLAAAVRDDMLPAQRQRLHARAFRHLAASGDLEAAAPHAIAADMAGDPDALDTVVEAAHRALRYGAVTTGLAQVAAAVEMAEPAPPEPLLAAQAGLFFQAGRPVEAVAVYRRLLHGDLDPERRTALEAQAAQALAYTGSLTGAAAAYERLFASLPPGSPHAQEFTLEWVHACWEMQGPAAALRELDRLDTGMRLAPSAEIDAVRAAFRLHTGDAAGTEAFLRACATSGREWTSDPAIISSHNIALSLGSSCVMIERFAEAEAVAAELAANARDSGALWLTTGPAIVRLGALIRSGRLAEALAGTEEVAEEIDLGPLLGSYIGMQRAWALTYMGRLADAEDQRAWAASQPGGQAWLVALTLESLRAERLLAEGDAEQAAEVFARIEARAGALGVGEPCLVPWAAGAAEVYLTLGRTADAERIAGWLEESAGRLPCAWPRLVAARTRAGLAAAAGDDERADALYRRAVDLSTRVPLAGIRVRLRYGEWLRRRQRIGDARPVLAQALRLAESVGASGMADTARAELTAAGGRRRASTPSDALTAQQARVAELAATGATVQAIAERLHLSPRTVETHLAQVYRKLGLRSKAELRRRWSPTQG